MAFADHKITCRKAEEPHILNGTNTPGYLMCLRFFVKNLRFILFFLVQVFFSLFSRNLFYLGLDLVSNISLKSLRYFSTSCNNL